MVRLDEEILEVDAVAGVEGRVVIEPESIAGRLAIPLGDIAEGLGLRRKQRLGDQHLIRHDLVHELFVFGKFANENENERFVSGPRGANGQAHVRYYGASATKNESPPRRAVFNLLDDCRAVAERLASAAPPAA